MIYKKSKYTPAFNQELEMRVFDVLNEAKTTMSIKEICASDIVLANQTPQKMTRILSELCDKMLVRRYKWDTKTAYAIYEI